MQLMLLEGERLGRLWPRLVPFVDQLVRRMNGRETLDTLAIQIRDEVLKVWIVHDPSEPDERSIAAVILTRVLQHPTGMRTGLIYGLSGKSRKRWKHLLGEMQDYFKKYGCSLLEVYGRQGWVRDAKAAGFRQTQIVFELDLTGKAKEDDPEEDEAMLETA